MMQRKDVLSGGKSKKNKENKDIPIYVKMKAEEDMGIETAEAGETRPSESRAETTRQPRTAAGA